MSLFIECFNKQRAKIYIKTSRINICKHENKKDFDEWTLKIIELKFNDYFL